MPQREYSESQLQISAEQGESSWNPWSEACSVTGCKLNAPKAQFSWVGSGLSSGSVLKNLLAKQETGVQFLGQEDPQEKKMATHSSILALKIPWTEEPGGLMGLQSQTRPSTIAHTERTKDERSRVN